jgi:serine/threonine-protein kinase
MEDALRDGLAGIGGTADLDSTRALPPEDATRMLPPTTATRPRQRLQPVEEPPRRQPPPARARRAAAPPPRRERSGAGKWIALLVVLIVIAAGVLGYQALNSSGNQQVQLNEQVDGSVDDAVGSFKQLVEDNTR